MAELSAVDIFPTSDAPRVLLIDLDNCPTQVNQLPQAVLHFSRVIVCYGGFEPKIHLNQLGLLASALMEGRLAIESMERKGKNAADFGLTFWAGRLLAEMPATTEFVILSQDTDLDYLMDMLRLAGRRVIRLDGNTCLNFGVPLVSPDAATDDTDHSSSSLLETAAEEYRVAHLNGQHPRPARRVTLLNSIRSHFKGSVLDAEAVLQELIRRGVLSMGRSGLISYRDHAPTVPINTTAFPFVLTAATVANHTVPMAPNNSSADVNGAADEYYAINIAHQRSRPLRRVTLLNSIRSYFKSQPSVEAEAVIAELFRRGVISQNRSGILRYHIIPASTEPALPNVAANIAPKEEEEAEEWSEEEELTAEYASELPLMPEISTIPAITVASAKIIIDTDDLLPDNQEILANQHPEPEVTTKRPVRKRALTTKIKMQLNQPTATITESDVKIPSIDIIECPF